MCGDLDEEDELETALYARFRGHAKTLLKGSAQGPETNATPAYMDALFADALARCLRDSETAEDARQYELLAAQPVVFARLAGFLAAHASRQEDPLRKIIEALMHGYAEAERIVPGHGHDHDDDHDDHSADDPAHAHHRDGHAHNHSH